MPLRGSCENLWAGNTYCQIQAAIALADTCAPRQTEDRPSHSRVQGLDDAIAVLSEDVACNGSTMRVGSIVTRLSLPLVSRITS